MTRRTSVAIGTLAFIGFFSTSTVAQIGLTGEQSAKSTKSPQATGKVVAGKVVPKVKLEWNPNARPEEHVVISVPAEEPLVEYVFTSRGGTTAHVRMLNPKFTREKLQAVPQVPEARVKEGQIDLVTTWNVGYVPFRFNFRDLKFGLRPAGEAVQYDTKYGLVTRVMRASKSGVLLDSTTLTDKSENTWSIDGPVATGDWVEIVGVPALAGQKFLIDKVDESGQIVVNKAITGVPESFAYRIVRTGTFARLFAKDPRFTRVSKEPGLPLVYVWPNPETDTSPLYIEKRYDLGKGKYELNLTVRFRNVSKYSVKMQPNVTISGWQHPDEAAGGAIGTPSHIPAASCFTDAGYEREMFPDLAPDDDAQSNESETTFEQREAQWIAVDNAYFLTALVSQSSYIAECALVGYKSQVGSAGTARLDYRPITLKPAPEACTPAWLTIPGHVDCGVARQTLGYDPATSDKRLKDVFAVQRNKAQDDKEKLKSINAAYNALKSSQTKEGTARFYYKLYTGPKEPDVLEASGDNLHEAMDYGILSGITVILYDFLRWLFSIFGSWPLAIILLTVAVKLVLLPLTNKSFGAMQKMQKLKPELDVLKEKYKGDRDKQNKAMFALYKKHKVNPLGGCLPMLLQMPIWIALYQMIGGAVELFHTPMGLWIDDLSAQDPYYILPVIMGLLMIVQNQISGSTASMDGVQAKMMKWGMPIMFTVFMLFLPSGLVLYILVNTTLTIFQNIFIRRRLA